MKHFTLALAVTLASCIQVGDAVMLIEGHAHPKISGAFKQCTLQVFYDGELYEQHQIAPAFRVNLVVAPGAEPARIDIACDGSKFPFSTISGGVKSDGQDIVRLGDIYLD